MSRITTGGDILLAVDLAHPESWDAVFAEALATARAKGAALHLLAIMPDFGMAMVSDYFPADFERKALENAREELRALAENRIPDDIPWQAHVGHGDVTQELLRVAADCGARMIVMAAHPAEGVRHFLLASQAERIVSRSPISVLVVRS